MRSKQMTRRIRGVRRHRLALALVGAMAMPMPVLAQSLPEFGDVVNGTASIGQTGTQKARFFFSELNWGKSSLTNHSS